MPLEPRVVARTSVIVLSLVGLFLLTVWLYGVVTHFLFLVLLAWLFAVAMEPGIGFFIRHGRSRFLGTAITGGIGLLAVAAMLVLFGDLLFQQMAQLLNDLPSAAESAIRWLNSTFHTNLDVNAVQSNLKIGPDQLAGTVESLSGGIFGVIDSVGSIVVDLATVLVFGFYIAAAGPHFLQAIAKGLRPNMQRVFVTVAEITSQKTGGYGASKIILAALSALFHSILFAVLQVPYWLPFGLFGGPSTCRCLSRCTASPPSEGMGADMADDEVLIPELSVLPDRDAGPESAAEIREEDEVEFQQEFVTRGR